MKNNIKNGVSKLTASLALLFTIVMAAPATVSAYSIRLASDIKPGGLPDTLATSSTVQTIIQIVFGIIGAFALMSMTASGLKYITAAGDAGKVSEAKKGIIFALVGLMVAVSAEAIVAFVVHKGAP